MIVLGVPFDSAVDMWSVGCTLYELYTGRILFPGKTNNDMLKCMMEYKGKFPHKMLRRGKETHMYFDESNHFSFLYIHRDAISGKVNAMSYIFVLSIDECNQ
jgi:serine/threonine-protein kinase PRP4